ncbi:hypothetical protein ADL26_16530 [Thermoactinomyces vulgaris]|nr:hypothetical protein ADL26_16530 [Thermoactinomyces vulgaris]
MIVHPIWSSHEKQGILIWVCLANQVGRKEAAEKPFLDERLVTREANEKMVLKPLAYLSVTLNTR